MDAKKEDGFTALHLAALNNHWDVAQILIREVWTQGLWLAQERESGPPGVPGLSLCHPIPRAAVT